MKRVTNNSIKNKLFMWVVLPIGFTLLWISLTAWYIIHLDTAFSVISYDESINSFTSINYSKLFKGDSISGVFTAEDNNLGIVAIKFQTFFRPAYADEDKILFQIKEKGQKNWYYQNIYRDGLIYNIPFFPFGFPLIQNSKGKIYEFRVTSLDGNSTNSIALSKGSQVLAAKYQYTKGPFSKNRKALVHFIVTKVSTAFRNFSVMFSSIVYFLPLIFYLVFLILEKTNNPIYQSLGKKKIYSSIFPEVIPKNRIAVFFFSCILILCAVIDIFVLQINNDAVYILITLLWVFIHKMYGASSKWSFIIGMGLLLVPPVFLAYNLSVTAEQAAIYAFLFLSTGVILLFHL